MKILTFSPSRKEGAVFPPLGMDIRFNIQALGTFVLPDDLIDPDQRANDPVLPILQVTTGNTFYDLMAYAGSTSYRQLVLSQRFFSLLSGAWNPDQVYVRTIKIRLKQDVREYYVVTFDFIDDAHVDIKECTFKDWSQGPLAIEIENPFYTIEEVPYGGPLDLENLALKHTAGSSKDLMYIKIFNTLLVSDSLAELIVKERITGIDLLHAVDQKILMPKWGGSSPPNLYYRE